MQDEEFAPKHRGMPRAEGARRGRGPVLPGLLVAFTLLAFIALRDPGATLARVIDEARGDSTSYAFVKTERNGDPVGWDPCTPIHYVVNPEGAPTGWSETVDAAIREVRRASRFRFVDDGTTRDRDFKRRTENDVLIAWAGKDEVPELEEAAGIGGATPFRKDGRTTYVSGVVVLDAEEYDVMERTGRVGAQVLILAHEMGHVLGLDHVDDTSQLMNPSYVDQRGFGSGDISGFELLHALPCVDD